MPASQLLLLLLLLQQCVCRSCAELFSESRDGAEANLSGSAHSNADMAIQPNEFLHRFGYLINCKSTENAATQLLVNSTSRNQKPVNMQQQHQPLPFHPSSPTSKPAPRRACTQGDIADAVRRFQANYELPASGSIDASTLSAMRNHRCGVGDSELAMQREAELISRLPSAQRVSPSVAAAGARARVRRTLMQPYDYSDRRFHKRRVTWQLRRGYESRRMSVPMQKYLLTRAFRMWSEVSPIVFVEEYGFVLPDVSVSFHTGWHGNCRHPFDGPGLEVAHARAAGDIHIDDDERFGVFGHYGVDLLRVFLHEIGHSLGLGHSYHLLSIMHPASVVFPTTAGVELHSVDRRMVEAVYDKCSSRINTMFDWLRNDYTNSKVTVYNTYIFSCSWYWMYDEGQGRPRYGDPKQVRREWLHVPGEVDAVVQVSDWSRSKRRLLHFTWFLAGDRVYAYDSAHGRVAAGYPKLITDVFAAKRGFKHAVPADVDSAVFHNGTKTILFFKDQWVYEYDPVHPTKLATKNCCKSIMKIKDRFPTARGQKPLKLPLDAVYHQQSSDNLYFISGSEYWQDVKFSSRSGSSSSSSSELWFRGKVQDKWGGLCHIEISECDLRKI